MTNEQIYQSILVDECLNELKVLRDQARRMQWYSGSCSNAGLELPKDLCNIADRSESEHEYILQESRNVIFNGIVQVVRSLLKIYHVEFEEVPSKTAAATLYIAYDKASPKQKEKEQPAPVFTINHSGERTLYIFKRFGIGKRWPATLVGIMKDFGHADEVRYVSLVDDKAYTEQINHNDDISDPTRGTGVLSLKQFFDIYFPKGEYSIFKERLSRVIELAKGYFGYTVVKSLSPNAMHLFRKEVAKELKTFSYTRMPAKGTLTPEQRRYLDEQYFRNGTSEALTGASDFASSFMTAEWLFQSLGNSCHVDLAPIVMDYYKSIEQFMFQFLCRHTREIDSGDREVFVLKKKWTPLVSQEALIRDRDGITLSGLMGFFGHWKKNGELERRNTDLLRDGITDETYKLINYALEEIPIDRNGYFHKDNLYTWEDAIQAREKTMFVFYLLLGAYTYSESDMIALDMKRDEGADDFNELCDYLNDKAHLEGASLSIPIFYINGRNSEEDALLASPNTDILGYGKKYGTPLYKGARFKRYKQPKSELLLARGEISSLYQGYLIIDRMNPSIMRTTGPITRVYEDGHLIEEK